MGSRGERPVNLIPRRLASFLFQAQVELRGVLGQFGHVLAIAKLSDQASRMPGGPRGQFLALQQHHVVPSNFRQMISNGAANDTATDDRDPCSLGEFLSHISLPL